MNLIALITASPLKPEQQMAFVKTTVTEGVEQTLLHLIATIHTLTKENEQLTAEKAEAAEAVAGLEAKLAEAEQVIQEQTTVIESSADPADETLTRAQIERKLTIVQALFTRESRQHKKTHQQLVAAKYQVAVLGSME